MARNVDTVGKRVTGRKDAGPGPFTRGQFSFKDTGSLSWVVTDDQAGDEIEIEATALNVGPVGPPGPPGPGNPGPAGGPGGPGPTGPAGAGATAFLFPVSTDILSEPQRSASVNFPSGMSAIRHIGASFVKVLTVDVNKDFIEITNISGIGGTTISVTYQTIVPASGVDDQVVKIGAPTAGDV